MVAIRIPERYDMEKYRLMDMKNLKSPDDLRVF